MAAAAMSAAVAEDEVTAGGGGGGGVDEWYSPAMGSPGAAWGSNRHSAT